MHASFACFHPLRGTKYCAQVDSLAVLGMMGEPHQTDARPSFYNS